MFWERIEPEADGEGFARNDGRNLSDELHPRDPRSGERLRLERDDLACLTRQQKSREGE
jgi:hypothetical protein